MSLLRQLDDGEPVTDETLNGIWRAHAELLASLPPDEQGSRRKALAQLVAIHVEALQAQGAQSASADTALRSLNRTGRQALHGTASLPELLLTPTPARHRASSGRPTRGTIALHSDEEPAARTCGISIGCTLPQWHGGLCRVSVDVLSRGWPERVRKRAVEGEGMATEGTAHVADTVTHVGSRPSKRKAKAAADGVEEEKDEARVPTGSNVSSRAAQRSRGASGASESGQLIGAVAASADDLAALDEVALQALAREHGAVASIEHVAVAREMLLREQSDYASLCGRQGLSCASAAESVLVVARALAWALPPPYALDTRDGRHAAMITNLQMLLQTGTASLASRHAPDPSFVAVAVELHREPQLGIRAACIRHGIWRVGHGETPSILYRSALLTAARQIGALRDRIGSLRLFEMELHTLIEPRLVEHLRAQVKVSVSQAAIAIRRNGDDLAAACSMLREETGTIVGSDDEESAILRLRSELGIKSSLNFVAAAREVIRGRPSAASASSGLSGGAASISPTLPCSIVELEGLLERHDLLRHISSIETVTSIAKQLALHEPPPYAINFLTNPADATLVHNLQLLLMTPTPSGGLSSRSKQSLNFIALAVEVVREPSLNFQAACIRHGVKAGHHLLSTSTLKHAWERIEPTARELLERRLLELNHSTPIDQARVTEVRERVKVSVSEAAELLLAHSGDVDAAVAELGEANGLGAAQLMEQAPPTRDYHREPLLVQIQQRLARRQDGKHQTPPHLQTIAVALDLIREAPHLSVREAFVRHGIALLSGAQPERRIHALVERVRALGDLEATVNIHRALGDDLEKVAAAPAGGGDVAAAGSSSSSAADAPMVEAPSLSSERSLSLEASAPRAPIPALDPWKDEAWLRALQTRLGPVSRPRGALVGEAALNMIGAAVEFHTLGHCDMSALCARHGVPNFVPYHDHVRDLRTKLRTKLLLGMPTEELLSEPPPPYPPELISSLQLRLTFGSTVPNPMHISVALDVLYHERQRAASAGDAAPGQSMLADDEIDEIARLDLHTAGCRRRAEHPSDPKHFVDSVMKVKKKMETLEEPIDAIVPTEAIERLREAVRFSGCAVPRPGMCAMAIVRHGVPEDVDEMLTCVNCVRAVLGEPPVLVSAIEPEVAQVQDEVRLPQTQATPIGDELLAELQAITMARWKRRSAAHLPNARCFRAAAELLTAETRDLHWKQLNHRAVCAWNGVADSQIKYVKELRVLFASLPPLDTLLAARGRGEFQSAQEEHTCQNLQLLLQTGTTLGGSSSKPETTLGNIAVALRLCRDARLVTVEDVWPGQKGMLPTLQRAVRIKEEILARGLLDLDHSRVVDRTKVDALRESMSVSKALAAEALLRTGHSAGKALTYLCKLLGRSKTAAKVVKAAAGRPLHLSPRNESGYVGVFKVVKNGLYEAKAFAQGEPVSLGQFSTAVEAAVAYADWRSSAPSRARAVRSAEDEDDVEDEDEDEGQGEEGSGQGDEEAEVHNLVPQTILKDNGELDDRTRWLVHWCGRLEHQATWVTRDRLPEPMLAAYVHRQQAAFNMELEPLLHPGSGHPSAVVCTGWVVPPAEATRCAQFLFHRWQDGVLPLDDGRKVYGWATYGKTLSTHDADQQRLHTLLFSHAMLPSVRAHLPGFVEMEHALTEWLQAETSQAVELFYAHGLRQGPHTLKSTGFDVHQDTEDFDFIEYTVVVKLTPDAPNDAPSAMRVVGAAPHFYYKAQAGAAGLFRARLYHASVAPVSPKEHLKIAFFFRTCSKKSLPGPKRTKATSDDEGPSGEPDEDPALAQHPGSAAETSA